jgi:hypothetical protein
VVIAAAIESSHLTVVALEEATLRELADDGRGASVHVHQFLACDVGLVPSSRRGWRGKGRIPVRELQVGQEGLLLARHLLQQVEGDVQGRLLTVLARQPHIGLGLGLVARLGLQTCGQRRLADIAQGSHVIGGDPLPQPQLLGQQHGSIVEHGQHGAHLVVGQLRRVVVQPHRHGGIGLALAEGHEHAHAHPTARRKFVAQGIGESAFEGQGQYDVNVFHDLQS